MEDSKSSIVKGMIGEDLALAFYQRNGFQLEKRNYRYKRGEIDLIVKQKSILVFIEVKYRIGNAYGHPEEFVSNKQKKRIIETANQYIEEILWPGNIRFDIIAINGQMHIECFEDAFY